MATIPAWRWGAHQMGVDMKAVQIIVGLGIMAASPALAADMTVQNVMDLVRAGIPQDAIVAKIRSSGSSFDLSADQMIALKNAGVSGPVLTAMVAGPVATSTPRAPQFSVDSADPMVPHPAGVYLLSGENGASMQRIDATVSDQAKTGGIWGYALTGGIASASVKASIQNQHARTKASGERPTFYFFFDEANPGTIPSGTWASGNAGTVTSPGEFSLVRFTSKDGHREARVGSMNIGGAKSGVMDKDRIKYDYQVVRPGVYRIVVNETLAPGEYGFLYALNGGGGGRMGAMTARVFDFSVS